MVFGPPEKSKLGARKGVFLFYERQSVKVSLRRGALSRDLKKVRREGFPGRRTGSCEVPEAGTCMPSHLSRVQLFVTPRTVARQAALSMGVSRQEYWSRLPFPSPGHHPDPGIEPKSLALQVDSLPSEPPGKPEAGFQCI